MKHLMKTTKPLKLRFLVVLLFIFTKQFASSQPKPDIFVRGVGKQIFVSKNLDSVYIKGLDNILDIQFKNVSDSISFQLIGFDAKPFGSFYPKIRYTNIPGGRYTLVYRLSSSSKQQRIAVQIEEAIWQKWWFIPMIAGYLLLLIGVGMYFFSLHNFRQKMKVQLMRNKISSDLHDEVGSNLSSISILSELIRKKIGVENPDLVPILDKIKENSIESVSLMQDTIWSLNANNDSSEQLFAKIENFAREFLAAKNISYYQLIDIKPNQLKIDMEARKNIYLIIKEGINNIGKHSDATQAELSVKAHQNRIYFNLKDNGLGFDVQAFNEGNGLRNFKERAEESRFEIEINSKINEGTELILIVST
jgi:two-component sensor histidine kinase